MSGVIYGLFGYVWMKSKFDPHAKMFIPPSTVVLLLAWLLLCWSGVLDKSIGQVANWAHTVGLIIGIIIGLAPVAWRRMNR